MTGPELGCIADDFTGGTDVAAALGRAGLRTALLIGAPAPDDPLPDWAGGEDVWQQVLVANPAGLYGFVEA